MVRDFTDKRTDFRGVTVGNVISYAIIDAVVGYQLQPLAQEMTAQANKLVERMQLSAVKSRERLEREAQAAKAELRARRAASSTGRTLARQCADWREADKQFNSYTSRTEMEKHCAAYEKYLATGVVPPNQAEVSQAVRRLRRVRHSASHEFLLAYSKRRH